MTLASATTNTKTEATTVETDGSTDDSVAATLGLNGQLFAIQLVNFAIVVAILWFLILKPLVRILEERKKIVDESIVNAKKVENEVQETNKRYQERMDEATVKANAIAAKSQSDAEIIAKEVKEEAKKEVDEVIAKSKQIIESDRKKMLEDVKKDVVDMVIASTEQVLKGAVDEKVDEKWLKAQLAKVNK